MTNFQLLECREIEGFKLELQATELQEIENMINLSTQLCIKSRNLNEYDCKM